MEKIDPKLEQLVGNSLSVFMKYGIKSVTMDDLARHLCISKKTIYKYVKDKNDLVLHGMAYHQNLEQCAMQACLDNNLNAIDENFKISKIIVDQIQNIHPAVMYDLQKYHPEAIGKFNEYKMTVVNEWVSDNMRRGIEEELYRADLNIPILTAIYLARMTDLFNPDLFPAEATMKEIYLEQFRYHIRGIASEKGVNYLKQKIKKEQKTQTK